MAPRRLLSLTLLISAALLAAPLAQERPPQKEPRPAQVAKLPPALELQVRLDRAGFSPGEIDGVGGRNTKHAQAAFEKAGSPAGDDAETLVSYVVTPEDVAGPFSASIPRDLIEQSKLPALNYTSPLEALGEQFHSSPALLQKLNPGATFAAGETIRVPNVSRRMTMDVPAAQGRGRAGEIPENEISLVVSRSASTLTVLDYNDVVIYHAPVTSGSEHDPLPLGMWAVTDVRRKPWFHYNPALFWDANPAHTKAKIPPGPNNPVGLVWINLTREHYGIHGTPSPNKIGHTQSHGCVRLTNWDALYVASLVRNGTVVNFVE